MAPQPEREPVAPASSSAPVQRAPDRSADVPASWLKTEHLTEAERLDRLAGDYELITGLALRGFMGREYDYFATELAKYGVAVISGWMRRGLIVDRCRERGYGGLPKLDTPFDEDVIEELAGETVSKALAHFRSDVLMARKWDYRKGATLRTYFIGQCLIRFANIYRSWLLNEHRNRRTDDDPADIIEQSGQIAGPEGRAVDRAAIAYLMSTIKDPRVRQAMLLTAEGRTQAEIAVELEVTEKTVERMLSNERTRLQKRRAG